VALEGPATGSPSPPPLSPLSCGAASKNAICVYVVEGSVRRTQTGHYTSPHKTYCGRSGLSDNERCLVGSDSLVCVFLLVMCVYVCVCVIGLQLIFLPLLFSSYLGDTERNKALPSPATNSPSFIVCCTRCSGVRGVCACGGGGGTDECRSHD